MKRLFFGALALALALAVAAPAAGCSGGAPEIEGPSAAIGGPRFRVEVLREGRRVVLLRDQEPLLVLAEDAFELGVVDELDEGASYDPWALEQRGDEALGVTFVRPRSFRAERDADGEGAWIALAYGEGLRAEVHVRHVEGATFSVELRPGAADAGPFVALARVRARTSGDPREGFYGLGEWQDSVDHRGKLRPMQIEPDPEIESVNNENHVPVPLLVGTRGWGIFAASTRVGAFDVARKDPAAVEVTFAVTPAPRGAAVGPLPVPEIAPGRPEPLRLYLFGADEPIDVLRSYYAVTGLPRLPPPWALGPWIWRDENRDQAEVEDDVAKIRDLDLATSGIWVDRPYARAVNTFDFDPARFPDPAAMIRKAHDAGLRFALWSTPYLEDAAQPLRGEADARGFFPPQTSVPLNKWSAPIDFTNPDAYAFWRGLAGRYAALGVEGFKLDYGEDVVPALGDRRSVWRFFDGSDERTMHHGYSVLYHRVYVDALPGDRFLLCRAAHWGEQSLGCVIWPGDMDATFTRHRERFTSRSGEEVVGVGGLPATVIMGLTLASSGFPFFGADTGGYRHSPPDKELFIRWAEQTALSSVMQVGDSSSQPPWVYTGDNGRDDEALAIYRTYARLHLRLFPYEWTFAQRMLEDGRPIQRPLGLAHPDLGKHPSDAYLFGEDLLVAPVVTRGERRRRAVVPAGTWIDWWDGAPYTPDERGEIEVDAPLEKLPILLRDGAIVPLLRPTIDTVAPAADPAVDSFARDPGLLWVRVAPGRPRAFTVWDGARVARATDGSLEVAGGAVFTRGFVLELMATSEPKEVTRGGVPLGRAISVEALEAAAEGWAWEPARRGTLWIKIGAGEHRVRVR